VDLLVPAKQRIVREQTLGVIDRITGEVRQGTRHARSAPDRTVV